jgi:Holliday junction resolvase
MKSVYEKDIILYDYLDKSYWSISFYRRFKGESQIILKFPSKDLKYIIESLEKIFTKKLDV